VSLAFPQRSSQQVTLTGTVTAAPGASVPVEVVVDPRQLVADIRRDNNSAAIGLPVPPITAVQVAEVTLSPSPVIQGDLLSINFRVANVGTIDANPTTVTIQITDRLQITRTLDPLVYSIPAGGSISDQARWRANAWPDVLVVQVTAMAGSSIHSRQASTTEIDLDVEPFNIQVSPNPVTLAQYLIVQFDVANLSSIPVQGQGRLVVKDGATTVAQVDGIADTLPPGRSLHAFLRWQPTRTGTFTLEISAVGNGTIGQHGTQTRSLVVNYAPVANLRATGLTFSPNPPLIGVPCRVSGTVTSDGEIDALPLGGGTFVVELAAGHDVGGNDVFYTPQSLSSLARGASVSLSQTFTPQDGRALSIRIRADPQDLVLVSDRGGRSIVMSATPLIRPDLAVAPEDLRLASASPRLGESDRVTLTVHNTGGATARQVPVDLFLWPPEAGGSRLGTFTIPSISSGTTYDAVFDWLPIAKSGPQTLVAIVNSDKSTPELSYDNNRASKDVVVQGAPLTLSNPYFSPAPGSSQATTDVTYTLPQAAPVVIRINRERDRSLVRTFTLDSSPGGTVTWDGKDSQGSVLSDGLYAIAVSTVDGIEQPVGALGAVIDTNRSQIHHSPNTLMSKSLDLRSLFTRPSGFDNPRYVFDPVLGAMPLPDDSGVIVFRRMHSMLDCPSFPCTRLTYADPACGFYFIATGSRDARRLTPPEPTWHCGSDALHSDDTMSFEVTGDGRGIVYTTRTLSTNAKELHYFSIGTQVDRLVATALGANPNPYSLSNLSAASGSDGASIVYSKFSPTDSPTNPRGVVSYSVADGTFRVVVPWTADFKPFGALAVNAQRARAAFTAVPVNNDPISGDRPRLYHVALDGSDLQRTGSTYFAEPRLEYAPEGSRLFDGFFILELGTGGSVWQLAYPVNSRLAYLASGSDAVWNGSGSIVTQNLQSRDSRLLYTPPASETLQTVAVSPSDDRIGYVWTAADSSTGFKVLSPDGTNPDLTTGLAVPDSLDRILWSPLGTLAWSQRVVLWTAANLTVAASVARSSDSTQLVVTGTAIDSALATYQLTVRDVRTSDPPIVLVTGTAPVVDRTLVQWTPPASVPPAEWGNFEFNLTATDKAGNRRQQAARLPP
jgi:hypothetical protein